MSVQCTLNDDLTTCEAPFYMLWCGLSLTSVGSEHPLFDLK